MDEQLLIESFKNKTINSYDYDKILENLYEKIIKNVNDNNVESFISSYNEYQLTIIYFINLAVYNTEDFQFEKYIDKINFNKDIIKFVMRKMKYPDIRFIAKNISPYILYNKNLKSSDIDLAMLLIKQSKILETKSNAEKFVELIIYRYMSSKNNRYRNFHEFYMDNFTQIEDVENFKIFFNDIINSTNIICYNVDDKIKPIADIPIKEIIYYVLSKMNYSKKKLNDNQINIGGNIIDIVFDPEKLPGISHSKYNLININNKETKNHIIIYFNTKIINNLSLLLTFIHYLTISLKLIDFKPNNIYELNNTHDMPNYFYHSFVYFLEYIKPQINVDKSYNKYIVDLFKFYYMYSFYDYILYAEQTVTKMLISDLKNSYQIMNDVLSELQNMFNFTGHINYPPFNNMPEDDINNIIYYSFENPNYFKLFDFVKALMTVFNIDKIKHFDKVFLKCIDCKIVSNVIKIEKSKPVINQTDAMFEETDDHVEEYILKI